MWTVHGGVLLLLAVNGLVAANDNYFRVGVSSKIQMAPSGSMSLATTRAMMSQLTLPADNMDQVLVTHVGMYRTHTGLPPSSFDMALFADNTTNGVKNPGELLSHTRGTVPGCATTPAAPACQYAFGDTQEFMEMELATPVTLASNTAVWVAFRFDTNYLVAMSETPGFRRQLRNIDFPFTDKWPAAGVGGSAAYWIGVDSVPSFLRARPVAGNPVAEASHTQVAQADVDWVKDSCYSAVDGLYYHAVQHKAQGANSLPFTDVGGNEYGAVLATDGSMLWASQPSAMLQQSSEIHQVLCISSGGAVVQATPAAGEMLPVTDAQDLPTSGYMSLRATAGLSESWVVQYGGSGPQFAVNNGLMEVGGAIVVATALNSMAPLPFEVRYQSSPMTTRSVSNANLVLVAVHPDGSMFTDAMDTPFETGVFVHADAQHSRPLASATHASVPVIAVCGGMGNSNWLLVLPFPAGPAQTRSIRGACTAIEFVDDSLVITTYADVDGDITTEGAEILVVANYNDLMEEPRSVASEKGHVITDLVVTDSFVVASGYSKALSVYGAPVSHACGTEILSDAFLTFFDRVSLLNLKSLVVGQGQFHETGVSVFSQTNPADGLWWTVNRLGDAEESQFSFEKVGFTGALPPIISASPDFITPHSSTTWSAAAGNHEDDAFFTVNANGVMALRFAVPSTPPLESITAVFSYFWLNGGASDPLSIGYSTDTSSDWLAQGVQGTNRGVPDPTSFANGDPSGAWRTAALDLTTSFVQAQQANAAFFNVYVSTNVGTRFLSKYQVASPFAAVECTRLDLIYGTATPTYAPTAPCADCVCDSGECSAAFLFDQTLGATNKDQCFGFTGAADSHVGFGVAEGMPYMQAMSPSTGFQTQERVVDLSSPTLYLRFSFRTSTSGALLSSHFRSNVQKPALVVEDSGSTLSFYMFHNYVFGLSYPQPFEWYTVELFRTGSQWIGNLYDGPSASVNTISRPFLKQVVGIVPSGDMDQPAKLQLGQALLPAFPPFGAANFQGHIGNVQVNPCQPPPMCELSCGVRWDFEPGNQLHDRCAGRPTALMSDGLTAEASPMSHVFMRPALSDFLRSPKAGLQWNSRFVFSMGFRTAAIGNAGMLVRMHGTGDETDRVLSCSRTSTSYFRCDVFDASGSVALFSSILQQNLYDSFVFYTLSIRQETVNTDKWVLELTKGVMGQQPMQQYLHDTQTVASSPTSRAGTMQLRVGEYSSASSVTGMASSSFEGEMVFVNFGDCDTSGEACVSSACQLSWQFRDNNPMWDDCQNTKTMHFSQDTTVFNFIDNPTFETPANTPALRLQQQTMRPVSDEGRVQLNNAQRLYVHVKFRVDTQSDGSIVVLLSASSIAEFNVRVLAGRLNVDYLAGSVVGPVLDADTWYTLTVRHESQSGDVYSVVLEERGLVVALLTMSPGIAVQQPRSYQVFVGHNPNAAAHGVLVGHIAELDVMPCRNLRTEALQLSVLNQLYADTDGTNWKTAVTTTDLASWCSSSMLTCDHGRYVRSLQMPDNYLNGPLPPTLGRLKYLHHLDLSDNALQGTLPASIHSMRLLTQLNVYRNNLDGTIPNIAHMSFLTHLNLAENSFTGDFPRLPSNIQSVRVATNQLSGPLPDFSPTMIDLVEFSAPYNHLSGRFPSITTFPSGIQDFILEGNDMFGVLPSNVKDIASNTLLLAYNPWACPIPDFSDVPTNDHNLLNNADLCPDDTSQYNALEALHTSTIGSSWTSQPSSHFDLMEWCGWSQLSCKGGDTQVTALKWRNNNMGGTIDISLGTLRYLEEVDFRDNTGLTGVIPTSIQDLRALRWLRLSNSGLGGVVPPLQNLDNLETISMESCSFTGPLPGLPQTNVLTTVHFFDNAFQDTFPQLSGIRNPMFGIKLGDNQLVGSVPLDYLPVAMQELHVSNNNFFGVLPDLNGVVSQFLYLNNNLFTCPVPVLESDAAYSSANGCKQSFDFEAVADTYVDPGTVTSANANYGSANSALMSTSRKALFRFEVDLPASASHAYVMIRLQCQSPVCNLVLEDAGTWAEGTVTSNTYTSSPTLSTTATRTVANGRLWVAFDVTSFSLPLTGTASFQVSTSHGSAIADTRESSFAPRMSFVLPPTTTPVPVSQADVLNAIFSATTGASWSSSPGGTHPRTIATWCAWSKVTCTTDLDVTGIVLDNINMQGTVSEVDFSPLTSLQQLHLPNNSHLTAGLGPSISSLTTLTSVDVSNTKIDYIPSLAALPLLQSFRCGQARLGRLPQLPSGNVLAVLSCNANRIDAFPDLSANPGLSTLQLSGNAMAGKLDVTRLPPSVLYHVDLSSNSFVGEMPDMTGRMDAFADTLMMAGNRWLCPIPDYSSLATTTDHATITCLHQEDGLNAWYSATPVWSNDPIISAVTFNSAPWSLADWCSFLSQFVSNACVSNRIEIIHLPLVDMAGVIPTDAFYSLPYLKSLELSDNSLTSPLPTSLWSLPDLVSLKLDKMFGIDQTPSLQFLPSLQTVQITNTSLHILPALPPPPANSAWVLA